MVNKSKGVFDMARFTLPRDLYHSKGALEALKSLKGTRAMVCTGSNPRKISVEEMEKLLKCCYYDTEVDF